MVFGAHQDPGYLLCKFQDDDLLFVSLLRVMFDACKHSYLSCWKAKLIQYLRVHRFGFGAHQDPGYLLCKFQDDDLLFVSLLRVMFDACKHSYPSYWKAKLIQYLRVQRFGFWCLPRSWIFALQIPG
ncbi:hypothetical protein BCU74_02750 [Vibrio breoganii]|nr:hypothetical protein BCU74_02750 [Vibrio breoganii]